MFSLCHDEGIHHTAAGNMLDAQASLALSRDGKAVLVAVLNKVDIMSPVSRKRMLSLEGHAAAVTAVCVHPHHVSQAYTASFDGTVRLWDISDGANLKQWNLHQPIYQLVISADGTYAYATILKSVAAQGNKAVSYVHQINLETNEQQRLFKCREPARLSLSRDGEMLLAVARRQLYVWLTSQSRGSDGGKKPGTSKAQAPLQLDHARDLVSVGCHPDGSFIATGDVRGEIFLWYQVKDALLTPATCAPICRCFKRALPTAKQACGRAPRRKGRSAKLESPTND
jgi:WD40 repeat protein